MKKTCLEIGRQLYEAEYKETAGSVTLKPVYTYSEDLNTCVAYFGFISTSNNSVSHFLVDTLSNIEIASSYPTAGLGLPLELFEQVKSELFFSQATSHFLVDALSREER